MAHIELLQVEKSLLRNKWDVSETKYFPPTLQLAQLACSCQFRDVLISPQARTLFQTSSSVSQGPFSEMFINLTLPDNSAEDELLRLVVAIACLQTFVQGNWTGPALDIHPLEVLLSTDSDSTFQSDEESINSRAIAELAFGGEPAYHLAKVPVFLRLSQLLVSLPFKHLPTIEWWRLRVATTHMRVLDETVASPINFMASLQPLTTLFERDPDLLGRLHLEIGLFEHHLSQDKVASDDFVKASRSTGLEYELTGALGKRTKFQVTELSQLVLLAESHLAEPQNVKEDPPVNLNSTAHELTTPKSANSLPETLLLNDDTLLEQTMFTSSQPPGLGSRLSHLDPSAQPPLHPLDQCILLSLCLNVRNTSPSHGLTSEQMSPYISRVISHPRNWSVHTMALLLRSRLESSRTRTVERSALQLQALIDQMPTSDSKTTERLLYFYSIPLPSKWEMEKELADRYLSLGVIKSALEIFERLEMWEDVVKCYGALEQREKGMAIVRDLLEGRKEEASAILARGKTTSNRQKRIQDAAREAKFWCLLGDLEPKNAADHYLKAWKTSKETSGRAMRSLGGYYFARGKYEEAIECLQKSVKINPLISRAWFILGCACMRLERWEDAKTAFSRCVALDEEDGESWNNLASMYLRIGQSSKSLESDVDGDNSITVVAQEGAHSNLEIPFENKMLAFRALKQGLKYSYDNWRMWYNYMIVSMDVGELQEACRALGRVVEHPSNKAGTAAVAEDVLDRLVHAVIRVPANPEEVQSQNEGAVHPNEGHGLYRSVLCLFERTLLPRLSSPRIFRAYARLLSWQGQWEDTIKAYLDGYRCSAAGTIENGDTDTERWRTALAEVEDIVDILRNFGPRVEGYKWRLQSRSIIRTFMSRTKDYEEEPEWERLTALLAGLRKEDN